MRVQVKSGEQNINLVLPTKMIFSTPVAWIASAAVGKYVPEVGKSVSPDAMQAIFQEFRRIKDRYGSWELVEVQSADGGHVLVKL